MHLIWNASLLYKKAILYIVLSTLKESCLLYETLYCIAHALCCVCCCCQCGYWRVYLIALFTLGKSTAVSFAVTLRKTELAARHRTTIRRVLPWRSERGVNGVVNVDVAVKGEFQRITYQEMCLLKLFQCGIGRRINFRFWWFASISLF